MLVGKYADHRPLYRQARSTAGPRLDLHRSTLADWIGTAAFHLAPVVERHGRALKGRPSSSWTSSRPLVLDPGREGPRLDISGRWRATIGAGAAAIRQPSSTSMRPIAAARTRSKSSRFRRHPATRRLRRLQPAAHPPTSRAGQPIASPLLGAREAQTARGVRGGQTSPIAAGGPEAGSRALYRIEAEDRWAVKKKATARRPAGPRRTPSSRPSATLAREQQRGRISAKSRLGEKLAYIANHWDRAPGLPRLRPRRLPSQRRREPASARSALQPQEPRSSPVTTRAARAGLVSPR